MVASNRAEDAPISAPGSRIRALDGVRGLAVLLVVAFHVSGRSLPLGGLVGVTIFFVLSGYLITGILFRELSRSGSFGAGRFYANRAVRLLPALIVVLLVTPLLMAAVGDPALGDYAPSALVTFLYLSDIAAITHWVDLGLLGHTWSLSVEEQFYLVWPALLLLVTRYVRNRRTVLVVVLSLAGAAAIWAVVAGALYSPTRVHFGPDTNAFALLFGAAVAVATAGRPFPRVPWWASVSVAALCVAAAAMPIDNDGRLMLMVSGVGAGLLGTALVLSAVNTKGPLENPVLCWFGQISYGLYLWHQVLLLMKPDGHTLVGAQRIVAVLLALALASLSYYCVERPLLRRRRAALHGDVGSSAPVPASQ